MITVDSPPGVCKHYSNLAHCEKGKKAPFWCRCGCRYYDPVEDPEVEDLPGKGEPGD